MRAPNTASILQDGTTPGPAEGGQEPASGGPSFVVPLLLIFVVFYFLVIGPDRKNRKKREAMLAEIKKGDKVMTTSGMIGSVSAISEETVTLQVADGVRIKFARQAIQNLIGDPREGADEAKTAAK